MNEELEQRADEIGARILESDAVKAAEAGYEAAARRLAELKSAQAGLAQQAKALFESRREAAGRLENDLIESRIAGTPFAAAKALDEIDRIDAEHRLVTRANIKILEHLAPQAEIAKLERAAEHLESKAEALRTAANERLRKTAELMEQAAEHEGAIVFDPAQTLSGVLDRRAEQFAQMAASHRTWAAQKTEEYLRLARELEAINPANRL